MQTEACVRKSFLLVVPDLPITRCFPHLKIDLPSFTWVDTIFSAEKNESTHERAKDKTTGGGTHHTGRDHECNLAHVVGCWMNNDAQSKGEQSCDRSNGQSLQLKKGKIAFDECIPRRFLIQQAQVGLSIEEGSNE